MNPKGQRAASLSLIVAASFLTARGAVDQESQPLGRFAQAGLRAALSEDPQVRQLEAFADWRLPWSYRLGQGFGLETYLSGSVGWIGEDADDAAVASFGPSFRLTYDKIPVALLGGSAPTILGRNHLGDRDMGCAFQFTSHIGLACRVYRGVELCYRFQHMSNAGLGQDNPGLNSHALALGWRF